MRKPVSQLRAEYPYPLTRAQSDAAMLNMGLNSFLRRRDAEIRAAIAAGIFS